MEVNNPLTVKVGPAEAEIEDLAGPDVVLNDLTPPKANVVVNVTATLETGDGYPPLT